MKNKSSTIAVVCGGEIGFVIGKEIAHRIAISGVAENILFSSDTDTEIDFLNDISLAVGCVNRLETCDQLSDAGIIVVAAMAPKDRGMTDDDFIKTNLKVISYNLTRVKKHAPEAQIILVTRIKNVDVLSELKLQAPVKHVNAQKIEEAAKFKFQGSIATFAVVDHVYEAILSV